MCISDSSSQKLLFGFELTFKKNFNYSGLEDVGVKIRDGDVFHGYYGTMAT